MSSLENFIDEKLSYTPLHCVFNLMQKKSTMMIEIRKIHSHTPDASYFYFSVMQIAILSLEYVAKLP